MSNVPVGWEVKELENICEIIKGKKPKSLFAARTNNALPYILIDSFGGEYTHFTEDYVVPKCTKNDVLMVMDGARSGLVAIGLEGAIGSTLAALRLIDSSKLDAKYLYYWLRRQYELLNATTKGAAIPHIDKTLLRTMQIPIPPLDIQKRLAIILDRANKLNQKREKTNQTTNKIFQAIFLQMFGDPIRNPKKWKLLKLAQIGTIARGKSKHRPRNAPELLGGKYPLIQTGDIANCTGYINEYHQTYSELGLKQSRMWTKGTLCITIAANIAATGILTFDACFPDSVVGFCPNENATTEYVQYWLSFLQKTLERIAPKAAQKNINLKILSDLDVPIPPIELQSKFSKIVEKVEALREKQNQSAHEIDELFNALLSKAFKGEIVQ